MNFHSYRPSYKFIGALLFVVVLAAFAGPKATLRHPAAVRKAHPVVASAPVVHLLHEKYTFVAPMTAPRGVPSVEARGGVLIDVTTGKILWERNDNVQLPTASTTKIMSSLVALENLSPNLLVHVSRSAMTQSWDESRMGIRAGQAYTVRELLSGMLTVSGNDAATALATDTMGLPQFVQAMNDQSAALQLQAHFATPVGLDTPQTHASALDLATIGLAAFQHFPLFRTLAGSREIVLPANDNHPAFNLRNFNELLWTYSGTLGIKPGWTGGAGGCLVALASRGGHTLVMVLLNAPSTYWQARRLLDWGFVAVGVPSLLPTIHYPTGPLLGKYPASLQRVESSPKRNSLASAQA